MAYAPGETPQLLLCPLGQHQIVPADSRAYGPGEAVERGAVPGAGRVPDRGRVDGGAVRGGLPARRGGHGADPAGAEPVPGAGGDRLVGDGAGLGAELEAPQCRAFRSRQGRAIGEQRANGRPTGVPGLPSGEDQRDRCAVERGEQVVYVPRVGGVDGADDQPVAAQPRFEERRANGPRRVRLVGQVREVQTERGASARAQRRLRDGSRRTVRAVAQVHRVAVGE